MTQFAEVPISKIDVSEWNPRLDLTEIESLAESIKTFGLKVPLLLRPMGIGDSFKLLAGHRRLAALKMLKIDTVPAVIQDAKPELDAATHAIENIVRSDLTPCETAIAVGQALTHKKGLKQEKLAQMLGKSPTWVSKFMTIYRKLPTEIPADVAAMTDQDKLYAWATKDKAKKNTTGPATDSGAPADDVNQMALIEDDVTCKAHAARIAEKFGLPASAVVVTPFETKGWTVRLNFRTQKSFDQHM